MKIQLSRFPALLRLIIALCWMAVLGSATAGLTFQMNVIHDCYGQNFTFAPNLYLNGDGGDSTPITYDQIYSPHTNFTGGVGDGSLNNRANFPTLAALMQAVTNGTWTLILNVGAPSQHTYTFTISSTLSTNPPVNAVVDYPSDGATNVPPLPEFAWHGPDNTGTLAAYVYGFSSNIIQYADASLTDTNAMIPPALAAGNYGFFINYESDVSTLVVATTPKDASNNVPANWEPKAVFDSGNQASFTVVVPPIDTNRSLVGGYTNIAHYTFDNPGNPPDPTYLGLDSSTNAYNMRYVYWGPILTNSSVAEAGAGAVQFLGFSSLEPFSTSLPPWTNTLAGAFSVSFWIDTTNKVGSDTDDGDSGQYLIYTDTSVSVGLTGSKVGFFSTGTNGSNYMLHSQQSVTTGQYVHIVATRDPSTGLKSIYINGQLDSTNRDGTNLQGSVTEVEVGGALGFAGYTGLMDDLQLYAGVLQSNDVSNLYAHPGVVLSNFAGTPLGTPLSVALNATNLVWTTSGDAPWFVETGVTYDGVAAAQSGSLVDSQSSLLTTTVNGPGTLTFYWKVSGDDYSFDLEFDLDSTYVNDIQNDVDWNLQTVPIPAGTHVLTWDANTFEEDGSSTNDTAWVDLVTFTPAPGPAPVSILNPKVVGTNFQFSFVSSGNHTNFIQYSTNLAKTNWLPYTNISGNGTTNTIQVPLNLRQEYFRINTQ